MGGSYPGNPNYDHFRRLGGFIVQVQHGRLPTRHRRASRDGASSGDGTTRQGCTCAGLRGFFGLGFG